MSSPSCMKEVEHLGRRRNTKEQYNYLTYIPNVKRKLDSHHAYHVAMLPTRLKLVSFVRSLSVR